MILDSRCRHKNQEHINEVIICCWCWQSWDVRSLDHPPLAGTVISTNIRPITHNSVSLYQHKVEVYTCVCVSSLCPVYFRPPCTSQLQCHRQKSQQSSVITCFLNSSALAAPRTSTSNSNGTGFVVGGTCFRGRTGVKVFSGFARNSRACRQQQFVTSLTTTPL